MINEDKTSKRKSVVVDKLFFYAYYQNTEIKEYKHD